ncbi:MAG: ABC transporter ATP-binding protein [Patescibacteria group bacterium]
MSLWHNKCVKHLLYARQFIPRRIRAIAHAVRQANAVMRPLDSTLFRAQWAESVFGGLRSIVTFAVAGFTLQHILATGIAKNSISWSLIGPLLGIYIVYTMATSAFSLWLDYRNSLRTDRLQFHLDSLFVEKIRTLDVGRLNDPAFIHTKDFAERSGRHSIRELTHAQHTSVQALAGLVAAIGVLAFLDSVLVLLAILPLIPQTLQSFLMDTRRREMRERTFMTRRRRAQYQYWLTAEDRVEQTRLFSFTSYLHKRFMQFSKTLLQEEASLDWLTARWNILVRSTQFFFVSIAFAYLAWRVVRGEIEVAHVLLFIGSMQSLGTALWSISRVSTEFNSGYWDFQYLSRFLETRPLIAETDACDRVFFSPARIEMRAVDFSYPNGTPALTRCTFAIGPGEQVIVVGANGSGKTTALSLLTRIYLPSKGQVCADGIDLSAVTQESWLRHTLMSTQHAGVPNFTVEEAITGELGETVDQARLTEAANMVGVMEFCNIFPQGLKTQIGQDWPGGVGLSGGQRQRIKIAAALYRATDPRIHHVFLDEPMSQCDPLIRQRFYQALKQLRNKTLVVVAHDPACLAYFDRILVFGHGTVLRDLRGRSEVDRYRTEVESILTADDHSNKAA